MRLRLLVCGALVALLAGCHDDGAASRPEAIGYTPACAGGPPPPPSVSPRRVRRLSDGELDAVVSDLLGGEPATPFSGLVPDPRAEGYDTDARGLVVSAPKLDAYVGAAERIAPRLAATARCYPLENARACAERFARTVATRAFGRPPSDEEIADLVSLSDTGGASAIAEAVLVAPSTLYRTEIGAPSPGGEIVLDDWEIASQLSFLLTGARPDEPLRAAAARGALHDPAVLGAEARRLLATPRARAQIRRFFVGWLELGKFDDVQRLGIRELTPEVKRAMADELDRFVEHAVFDGEGTLDELLSSSRSFVPPALAPIYGADLLEAPATSALAGARARAVALDPSRRRGLLSLPAFLTQHAGIDATNPVDRGLFVRTRMLCQELGAPPLAAFKSPIAPATDLSTTTRQKYEQHATDPACSSCHSLMDPIGFGFERFDAIGRYREKEHGQVVDDSGFVDGADVVGPFHGPAELAQRLAGSDEVRACFVAQAYRFAEGRRPDDPCELGSLVDAFVARGDRIDELFVAYVSRREFVVRRSVP